MFQPRDRLEETHHLVGTEHDRQLARLARMRDPLRQVGLAQRDPVEKAQGTDGLAERRQGHAASHQMHLESANILKIKPIRRATEKLAEFGYRMHVGSLGCRRQVADRHVLNHPAAQRAHSGHLGISRLWGGLHTPRPWQTGDHSAPDPLPSSRERFSSIQPSGGATGTIQRVREQALRIGRCSFTVQWDGTDAEGKPVIALRDVPLVEGLEMAAEPGTAGAWPRSVFLGEAFYEHLREHAVPLDKRAVAYLAGNSLGLDLYALFAYRLPRLRADLALRWTDLAEQLGAGDTSMSSFGQRVREVLLDVLASYPEAKVEVTKHGLTLRPSQPSVPRTAVSGFRL